MEAFNNQWDFKQANLWFRRDCARRFANETVLIMPEIAAANPTMTASDVPYSAAHCAVMDIIDQLFEDAPTKCTSDIAWEVMYALGFDERAANALALAHHTEDKAHE